MKKIINRSVRSLTFPTLDFSIRAGEIKKIDDNLFFELKNNVFIELYDDINTEKKVDHKLENHKRNK